MRVLVVEDDPCVSRTNVSLLRRTFTNVDVVVVENADEAITLLKKSTCEGPMFDLVLSDYNLHGSRTGGDVLDWIKKHDSLLAQRFVFLSSDAAIRCRDVPFFEKPCDINALRTKLREIVGGM